VCHTRGSSASAGTTSTTRTAGCAALLPVAPTGSPPGPLPDGPAVVAAKPHPACCRSWATTGLAAEAVSTAAPPAEQVGRVLIGLLPGFVFQHALLGDVDAETFRAGLRTLLATRLESPVQPGPP
jgi:hypothetical protein